jgi:hypothetical protein
MNEMIAYCLVAFAPPFLLRLLAAWLPRRLQWLRWLLLLYPAALLGLAALALGADPGFFIGWNAFVAGWFAILAGLALVGFGLGAGLGKLMRKRRS